MVQSPGARQSTVVSPATPRPSVWKGLLVVVGVAFLLQSYGISRWPLADDEVPSLVELGRLHIDAEKFFSVPAAQIPKLPRATIVWNVSQRAILSVLPDSEVSYRIPSLMYGLLMSALAFAVAARWRGTWFAAAVSIVMLGSQLFVYLAQVNRYYSPTLLLLALALLSMWLPRRDGWRPVALTVALTALTVLSHNVTIAVFALAFLSALAGALFGSVPRRTIVRSAWALGVSGATYLLYLRPLIAGWNSTGNPTPALISFSAHAGIALLALAMLGAWFVVVGLRNDPVLSWAVWMALGSLCVYQLAPISWNPRYFLFFLPAYWLLAAHAMEMVALQLGRGVTGSVWYVCVVALLAPSIISHLQDGSRHDYRAAAAVVGAHHTPGEPILSDDAETISYYLSESLRTDLAVRTKVRTYPESGFLLVCRSNAWIPQPEIPGRQVQLLAEIAHRRFDQFSHILRVYQVAPLHRDR